MANPDISAGARFKFIEPSFPDKKRILEETGIRIKSMWTYGIFGEGDATGGYIIAPINLADRDSEAYWYITEIFTTIVSGGGDPGNFIITTNNDQWERLYVPSLADDNLTLYIADLIQTFATNYSIPEESLPQNGHGLIALGRPRNADTNAGLINLIIQNNVDANQDVNIVIKGICTEIPIISPTTLISFK